MALDKENNGNESQFDGWNGNNNGQNNQQQQQSGVFNSGLLGSLFGMNSMVADNRNLKIVSEVYDVLGEKIFKDINTSTTDDRQRKIVPKVEQLTQTLSPQLPGLGFWAEIDGTMFVMAALFSNRDLNIGSESITVNNAHGSQQRTSIPLTPAAQINERFINNLKEHYTQVAASKGINNLVLTNLVVQDMEMLNHPESGETKDWPFNIAQYLATQWEESLLVYAAKYIVQKGAAIPSPWLEPNHPYGKDNAAEARVQAVSGRVTRGKTLSPANMEVIVTTMNSQGNNGGQTFGQSNTREIIRASAAVSLAGVPWTDHQQQLTMQMQSQDHMANMRAFLGNSFQAGSVWQGTYRPLRPEITIDTVQAGEMLRNNGGIFPWFYGLYSLMTSNNQFVWAEALRKSHVGGRGSLVGLETRIKMVAQDMPGFAQLINPKNNLRIPLDDKNINDTDFVTNWIRQNVSPHAIFRVNLIPNGPDSPIVNFLRELCGTNSFEATKTVVALIDSMTKFKFSEIVNENKARGTGWFPDPQKPILINTNTLVVNGMATSTLASRDHKERFINTQEVDEMFICNSKPGDSAASTAAIDSYLGTVYGNNPNENPKERSQKLRVEHGSSLFDGRNHINSFGSSAVFDPGFMAAMAAAMDSIGSLNAANNLGSFRVHRLASTPGIGLATLVGAGSNGLNLGMNQSYNINAPLI